MLRVLFHSIEDVFQTLGGYTGQDDFRYSSLYGTGDNLVKILVVFSVEVPVRVDEFHYFLRPNFAFTLSVMSVVSQP